MVLLSDGVRLGQVYMAASEGLLMRWRQSLIPSTVGFSVSENWKTCVFGSPDCFAAAIAFLSKAG